MGSPEHSKGSSDGEVVHEQILGSHEARKEHHGTTLIPRPSDDPRDPLNWLLSKKIGILAVISFATFSGFSACLAGQLQVVPQSKLYHVTTNQMAYQNSAASAGMAAGGFFFFPLSHVIGRSSAIFWSLVGTMLSQVWAALMTNKNQYDAFIVSRFFAAFFGSVTGVLGPRILVDLFFLHQRGRAFTVFHWCFDFGTVFGPTISALIAANTNWTYTYKWTAGLVGASIVTVFLFLEETSWNRDPDATNTMPPANFFANRLATFLPGNKVTPKASLAQTMRVAATPFLISASPVTLVLSVYTLINFGFYIAMNAISPVFLQKAVSAGGYSFNTMQNAEFSFAHWVGILFALIYGQYISDRLPLYLCKRFNAGVWKPEYRLHALWIPSIISPIGLGLWGAGLEYHLHWIVLAVAVAFVTFGSLAITPITVNYINEAFIGNPAEASIAVNVYRVGFGLSVAFYIKQWVASTGVGWAYGTMAFMEIFSFFFILLLMWKGHAIRGFTWGKLSKSEEGEQVVEGKEAASA